MSTGKPYEGEEDEYNTDVKIANTLTTKIPIFDIRGKVVGILGVSFDITDRKRAEQLEKQKELYEIAKGVAHDISTR